LCIVDYTPFHHHVARLELHRLPVLVLVILRFLSRSARCLLAHGDVYLFEDPDFDVTHRILCPATGHNIIAKLWQHARMIDDKHWTGSPS
jgi:hypothetical protein